MKTMLLWLFECNNASIIALLLELGGNWSIGYRGIFKILLNIYGGVFCEIICLARSWVRFWVDLCISFHYDLSLCFNFARGHFYFSVSVLSCSVVSNHIPDCFKLRITYVLFPVGSRILAHFMPIFHFYTP